MKFYGRLSYNEPLDQWHMDGTPAHVKIKLKKIFEAVPKGHSSFTFQNTKENCLDLEWFTNRYPMAISKDDKARLTAKNEEYREFLAEMDRIFTPDYTPHDVKFNDGLAPYKYQQKAIDLFWKTKRLLVGDEVGLGKTITAIGALTKIECLPALVVVQPHLTRQWAKQFEKFTNLRVHVIETGKPYSLPEADVYICKYTNIYKWSDVFEEMTFKALILDEVQEVRRQESRKHEGCKMVADRCEYVMGLSGTPIFNYGFEVWTLYNVIRPGLLDDETSFRREWCGYMDRVADPVALGSFLRDAYAYIRRTNADEEVQSELPPVNKIVHTVGFDQKAIDAMEDEAKMLAIQVLQGEFVERGQAARELSILIRKKTGVSKARDVANYVKMILENGEKVLLAGWHRDVYDIWLEELKQYNPVMYTGSESAVQKDKNKEAFINGESQVMIISLRSGVGLDGLQGSCKYAVLGELDWTNAVHEQVIGRLYREGQPHQVNAIFLVSDSGSDPVVMDILALKKSQQDGINDPNSLGTKQESDDSIIKEFAKRYLETKGHSYAD